MSDDGDHPKTRAVAASVAINNCRCRKGRSDLVFCRWRNVAHVPFSGTGLL